MWIVSIALRRPYTFVVAALLVILSSVYVLRNMATDIFPNINIPVVAMIWEYKGMTPKEMADRVSGQVERSMTLIDGIEHIESVSFSGASVIKVFFHQGTDIRTAIAQVMASSNSVFRSLPPGITPPQIIQYSASDLPLLQLGLSSKTVPETEVADLSGNVLRNVLQSKKGLSLTRPYGTKDRQISVDLDSTALLARGLSPVDLVNTMAAQNLILPTGTIKLGDTELDVTLNGSITKIATIADLPVITTNGNTIFMRDVAQVRDGSAAQQTIARQNGERGVLTSVFKVGNISTLEVVDHVKQSIPKILDQMPPGIDLNLMFDQSLFVKAAVGNVVHEALIAASLTAALILLFLGSWRSTCIIAVSIPLSIMCSLIVLYMIGETINLMTLGGLALAVGILVDDATVEIENIERHMAMGKPIHQAIMDGAAEIAVPAFVSTLCICIVFVPMFFLSGVAHFLFVPLAEAVVFAMLASYIISRTLVPTLAMYLLANHEHGHGLGKGWFARIHQRFNRGFEVFRQQYVSILAGLLNRRELFGVGFLLFCLLSLGLYPLLGQDLFPAVDAGQIRLHLRATSGVRLEEMPRLVNEVEDVIRARIPKHELGEVLDIIGGPYSTRNTLFGNSGTVETADTEIMISLKANQHGPSAEYISDLRSILPERFPGVEFFFQPADQISQTLNFGIPAPIDIQFMNGKPEEIMPLIVALNNKVRKIPGIVDAHVYQRWSKPTLDLEMNRTQLNQAGLSARDVAQNLLISLSGSMQTAPSYWLNPVNGNSVNIGVKSNELTLDNLDALMRTPIGTSSTSGGNKTQLLGNLVTLKRSFQQPAVTHYNSNNVFNIYANVQDRDLGSVSRDLEQLIDEARSQLPRGAEITLRGQVETLNNSFMGLAAGLAVAILLVYLLIVVNFQSWLDPLIIISALPAALAGIAWTLYLTGTTLSVPALTGIIMTMGVATANSILVVSFARTQLQKGTTAVVAALEAGSTRLRPVLMTAFAMIVGMLPMAIGIGEGAEQNAPLGKAVIGGLLFATISTLIFVPIVFAALHRLSEHRHEQSSHLPDLSTH